MLKSAEIQKNSNTFFIIRSFNKYICYETCMGNPIRIEGQIAAGSINRISFLTSFLRRRDGTEKFKIFYYEFSLLTGLILRPLPWWLTVRKKTKFYFEESQPQLVELNYNPFYEMIVRGPRIYFCIESNNNYFLYDDDFENPLLADITLENGKSFIIRSKEKGNTLQIINSLPEESVVYSLKVTNNGIVPGNEEMNKFKLSSAKNAFEHVRFEKTVDKTRSMMIKRTIQKKKIDGLKN